MKKTTLLAGGVITLSASGFVARPNPMIGDTLGLTLAAVDSDRRDLELRRRPRRRFAEDHRGGPQLVRRLPNVLHQAR